MKTLFLLPLLFTIVLHGRLWAQPVDCNSFCVENIWLDTVDPGILYVTIHFTGDSNAFINYPYVSEIVDINGNVVVTGTLNFFGQFANTSQDYPMTTTMDFIPEEFSANLYFYFDTVLCVLQYPCLTSSVSDNEEELHLKVYPNPVTSLLIIEAEKSFEDATINIFNAGGQMVKRLDHLSGDRISIERGNLPDGIYYVHILDDTEILCVYKVLVLDTD